MDQASIPFSSRLGTKINAVLVVFFAFALTVILLTLYVARQLEGGAAAINDAGSQRMRIYELVYRLHAMADDPQSREESIAETHRLVNEFQSVLSMLEKGDPDRPLFLPRAARVQEQIRSMRSWWDTSARPQIEKLLVMPNDAERRSVLAAFDGLAQRHVSMINELVLMVEQSNARNTYLMYMFQYVLVSFALLGTLLLVYLFNRLVIRPVDTLRAGIERMAESDFGVRLSAVSRDEFGALAVGFNRMAGHLQNIYATLEQRVMDKTRSVEERNRELALLYEVAAYLGEPATLEAVCHGVLHKLCNLLDAPGGVVRLNNAATRVLEIAANHNMSEAFIKAEAHLPEGACLCGGVAVDGSPITRDLTLAHPAVVPLTSCMQEGFAAMAAIPIRSKNQVLGVLNLFFRESRILTPDEMQLLEAIGQHLGVAIENLRLVVREKEMAVSEERNLLAQELHDSIAQSLAFLNIQAQMLQDSLRDGQTEAAGTELARIREGIQESYDNVRELLVHFRIKVDHANLDEAIRSALEKFEGQTGIRTSFNKRGPVLAPAATSVIQILHILQEALSNVRKHAEATAVEVDMQGGEEFTIAVCDNGKGFEPKNVVEADGSYVGIGIMRERAHRIGARLEVVSTMGRGTCVTLALPR